MHNSTIHVFFLLVLAATGNIKNTDCRIVHLLALTEVLIIHHNARNEKYVQYGAFVYAAMIFTDP